MSASPWRPSPSSLPPLASSGGAANPSAWHHAKIFPVVAAVVEDLSGGG